MQATDISKASKPRQAGFFSPVPLTAVALEDPGNGLIYVVDIRNGLNILRYLGPHHGEVDRIEFLEGNSNRGDAIGLAAPEDELEREGEDEEH